MKSFKIEILHFFRDPLVGSKLLSRGVCFQESLGSVLGDIWHIKGVFTFRMGLGKECFVGCPIAFLPTKQVASQSLGKAAPRSLLADCKEEESVQEDGVSPVLFPKVLYYPSCPHCKFILCKIQHVASLPFSLPPQYPPLFFLQEQIRSDLENLKRQKEEQKIVSEFRQLRRFLKEKEVVLLARLGELDRAVLRRQEEEEAKVEGDISLLSILICEMEEKLKRPARGFLQVGSLWVGYPLDPLPSCPTFSKHLENDAFVTLDPTTATAGLVLSRDRRGVRWMDTGHDVSPCPQRFDVSCCVLGCWGFTSGQHFWDVEVMGGGTWALGVARGSVPRKGWLTFHPDYGIWAMGSCRNSFRAFTSPPSALPMSGNPNRIRVVLDYGGGRVAFYLTAPKNPIFAFQNASFCGESIFPFFWVEGKGRSETLG
uniref:B30.2/SPRY domain-containing protein n=1 Tax=Pavo cristatus TaxID=9049 RepID=A0A8C9EYD1_PAVCR